MSITTVLLIIAGTIIAALLLQRGWRRLELSRAKHRSLSGHARWARRFASLVPFYEYSEAEFFRADDAPEEVASQRHAASAACA